MAVSTASAPLFIDKAGVEPGKMRQILVECAEIVGMKGARDDVEPSELALHRPDETRMQMAEARRRIGAHHVDVAPPLDIEQMRAPAMRQHDRQRRVILRAEADFPVDEVTRETSMRS